MIEIDDIHKSFEANSVLKGVYADIKKGEIFTIIGPSGQGKSTLLRILNTLERPSSGQIFFDGNDLFSGKKTPVEVRRRMSMVFQKTAVFDMNVFDNIAIGLKYRGYSKTEISETVNRALDEIGLSGYGGRSARTLSGGEMQRVALARAIVSKPDVLYLDEPTASLDPVNTEKIEDLILHYNKEYGTTIVMSTHDMLQGQRLSDRIGVMMDGRFLQIGTPDEIFSRPGNENVARFIGINNVFYGTIKEKYSDGLHGILKSGNVSFIVKTDYKFGDRVAFCIRPEEITVHDHRAEPIKGRNMLPGKITGIHRQGRMMYADIDTGIRISAMVTWEQYEGSGFVAGDDVMISFKPRSVFVMGKV